MKQPLRLKIYHKTLELEDKYVLDKNLPDWLANPLFRFRDVVNRISCTALGHQWDGWRNGPGSWCVLCDKQEKRGK